MVLVEYAYVTEYPFWVLRESGNTWLNARTRIHDKHIWCKLRMVVCRVEKGKKNDPAQSNEFTLKTFQMVILYLTHRSLGHNHYLLKD